MIAIIKTLYLHIVFDVKSVSLYKHLHKYELKEHL